jgi:hypothetical protein
MLAPDAPLPNLAGWGKTQQSPLGAQRIIWLCLAQALEPNGQSSPSIAMHLTVTLLGNRRHILSAIKESR